MLSYLEKLSIRLMKERSIIFYFALDIKICQFNIFHIAIKTKSSKIHGTSRCVTFKI